MGGRFGEVKPGQRHERQRVKRACPRAEETVVKTDAAPGNQRKRQAVQTTLTVFLAELRHQQEIKPDADDQNRQDLAQNIRLHVLNQQRARRGTDKGHQDIELLVGQAHHLAADKIERRRKRAAAGLQLVGGKRLRRAHARRQQRGYG